MGLRMLAFLFTVNSRHLDNKKDKDQQKTNDHDIFAANSNDTKDEDQEKAQDENLDLQTNSSTRLAPLIPALGCPLSSLLEIPVLTEHNWAPSESSTLLFTGLIFSVILAFMANVSLICRYFEHRPQLSTLAAIASLTIHDCLNLMILIEVAVRSPSSSHHAAGTFWMLVASSLISVFCNLTLIIDYVRVDNFRAKGSGLTTKQRTFVIVVMSLLLYIGFGAVIFALLESHQINFSDALYFSVCTVTTVGFGDITPTRTITRVFNFFYAIVGVVLLALTVSTSRDTFIEAFESLVRSRRRAIAHQGKRLYKAATKHRSQDEYDQIPASNTASNTACDTLHRLNSTWRSHCWTRNRKTAHTDNLPFHTDNTDPKVSFQEFQHRLLADERKELRSRLFIATLLSSCFWFLGAAVFKFTEGWTYGQALYFGYVAFLTLGYGDFTVHSSGGRAFFIAWSLLGIGNMTLLLAVLTQAWEMRYKRAISESRNRKLALSRQATAHLIGVDDAGLVHKPCVEEHEGADVNQTLDQLIVTAEEFLKHAQYWMNGKTGEAPPGLIHMMQEAEKVEGLEQAFTKGGLIDKVTSDQRRRVLFLMSFAKSFELLTQQVCQTKAIVQANAQQLDSLQNLIKSHQCTPPSSTQNYRPGPTDQANDSQTPTYCSYMENVYVTPTQAVLADKFSIDQVICESPRSTSFPFRNDIVTPPAQATRCAESYVSPTLSTFQHESSLPHFEQGDKTQTRKSPGAGQLPDPYRTPFEGSSSPIARPSLEQSLQTQRLLPSPDIEASSFQYTNNGPIPIPPPPLKNNDRNEIRRT
ncbi:hypothetical protein MJO29_006114 [Puccinia striiformis f. sp. tritici]|nr:hypothetical protein MJO29_006114 [Puccinia striiformis f. sp. tritici]